jgi:cytochrome d ubiquinol oxidase subunit II
MPEKALNRLKNSNQFIDYSIYFDSVKIKRVFKITQLEEIKMVLESIWFFLWGGLCQHFPSNIDPSFSLTAHNAASSDLTLKIMPVVVILFVPIVLIHQARADNLFMGKVDPEDMTC